jgi:hypothetical protein
MTFQTIVIRIPVKRPLSADEELTIKINGTLFDFKKYLTGKKIMGGGRVRSSPQINVGMPGA